MNTNDTTTPVTPRSALHGAYCLDDVPDNALHANTRRLVGRSNQLRALVLELKARKTGATRRRAKEAHTDPRQRGTEVEGPKPRQRGAKSNPRQRGSRYVPRAVRRAVWERDGGRCTYVDGEGRRCRETGGLEVDHVHPRGRGGVPTVENLRLRCRAHNALTAENDFGRDFMAQKKGHGLRHDRML